MTDVQTIAQQIADEHLPEETHLIHVDYRDSLTDEQVGYLLADDRESLHSDMIEWMGEAQWYGVKYHLDALEDVIQDAADENDVYADSIEEHVVDIITDRDESDPVKELISNTSKVFVRYRLDSLDEDNDIATVLRANNLDPAHADNLEAIQDIEANAFDVYNGMHNLYVIAYVELEDILPGRTVKLTDPHIVALDTFSGQGFDGQVSGEITLTLTAERGFRLDSADQYGWEEVCGAYTPAYDTLVTKIEDNA